MSTPRPLLTRPRPIAPAWLDRLPPAIPEAAMGLVGRVPALRRLVSRLGINSFAYATALRPRPLTLASDYTSWKSLTDRSYSGRHLPPADPWFVDDLPSQADVVELYRRKTFIPSTDTSVTFSMFAQWFTDSFLRTDHHDTRKNTSNHEIDLCQIYGLSEAKTDMLRAHRGGRLKSQLIDGAEFPVYLFERRTAGGPLEIKKEFEELHDRDFLLGVILADVPDDRMEKVFAVGLEHGNSTIGNSIMNVVFLREHNRVAGLLEAEFADDPAWDDDRIFETARNVLIALLVKLVVEEYIKHIAPFEMPLEAVPFIADGERWNRSNWIAVEFDLLYRWHPLVPDEIGSGSDAIGPGDMRNNNPLVLSAGVEGLLARCSTARAGRIGLGNTPGFLVDRTDSGRPSVEERTVGLSRDARLRSFNEYREAFGLKRLESWEELTDDVELRRRLHELYGDIDDLEWYVGIFAESYPPYLMMGELMTTMVACDAFTQALTNPLLGRHVFNEATFSELGFDIIKTTSSLEQIVKRNATTPGGVRCSFRC